MNALNVEMCESMVEQFATWASAESVAAIVLDGTGERAFCSGGDVVTTVKAIRDGGPLRYVYGDRLFAAEYRLVRQIFEYPKPFVCWMHGITMGAGLGLAVAAAHRIVSPGARLAMPETRIGLFPDVGAAWFLGRAPANAGPFLASAGVLLDSQDALFLGMADTEIDAARRAELYDRLAEANLSGDVAGDHDTIARLLATFEVATARDQGSVAARLDALRRIGQARTVETFHAAIVTEARRDPWFAEPLANVDAGSPTSVHVGLEHFRRMKGRSLREVLDADLKLARAFVRGHDFPEGVRAALIDKDRRPVWNPPALDEVLPPQIAVHFAEDR